MELLVAVAVLAIGASLAAPTIAGVLAARKVQVAAEGILGGLRLARSEAMRRNAPVRFTLLPDGWKLALVASGASLQSYRSSHWTGLHFVRAGGDSVTFMPGGTLQASTHLSRVTVASGAAPTHARQVDIFGGGLMRMCDPAVAIPADPRRC